MEKRIANSAISRLGKVIFYFQIIFGLANLQKYHKSNNILRKVLIVKYVFTSSDSENPLFNQTFTNHIKLLINPLQVNTYNFLSIISAVCKAPSTQPWASE